MNASVPPAAFTSEAPGSLLVQFPFDSFDGLSWSKLIIFDKTKAEKFR